VLEKALFDKYFLVKRNLSILNGRKEKTIDELIREVSNLLKRGNTVVVDEFQRLNESVL
jgi:hypothetical protein